MKKQLLNLKTDFARLLGSETDFVKQMMERGLVPLDAEDYEEELEMLRSSEAAFFWESPPTVSQEEAKDMARKAVMEMAPEPGREILAAFLHITVNAGWGLVALEEVVNSIQESFDLENKGIDLVFSCVCGDEGTHFVLFTAERKKEM